METTVAVLSDLHCHHESSGFAESLLVTTTPRKPTGQHPVSALLDLIKLEKLQADALLMPGDIANKVDPQGMISGWAFVNEIANSLQATVIAPTLGNHDVISRNPSDDPFSLAKALHPEFPSSTEHIYNEFWANGFCIVEGTNFRIAIVNSVASHTNEASAKRGLVSDLQLAQLKRALESVTPKPFQVAVCHHHPILHEDIGLGTSDIMVNGSLLVELLSGHGFHLLVHGHKHHPKLSYVAGAEPLPILAAGSFSAGMKNGLASRTRNVFHVITLSRASTSAGVYGLIRTWQFQHSRGWTPASSSATDFPHKAGFGCYSRPGELAEKVEAVFRHLNRPIVKWTEIASAIPELRFVIPVTLAEIQRTLTEKRMQTHPAFPDEPTHLGSLDQ
jgi:hypothetical protein